MNLPRIYLISILLLAFGVGTNGQEPPKAVLVDEYSVTPCGDFVGRLDVFLSEFRPNPASTGLIVISHSPEMRHSSMMLKSMMEAHFKWRGFDGSRIEIARIDADKQNRQFWRLPPGAGRPKLERVIDGYQVSDVVRKPFMLTEETTFGTNCPEIDDQPIYAEFLKANPTARGNIVVRDSSETNARRRAGRVLRTFRTKYGISRSRIRTFVAKLERPANHDQSIVEYWYLP